MMAIWSLACVSFYLSIAKAEDQTISPDKAVDETDADIKSQISVQDTEEIPTNENVV